MALQNTTTQDSLAYRNQLASVLGGQTPANMSVQPNMTPVPTPTVATATKTVAPVVTPTQTVTPTAPVAGASYTVAGGDSLSKIAQKNGMSLSQLLELNPSYKANPNLVQIGATLNISGGQKQPATVVTPSTVTQTPSSTQNHAPVVPTTAQTIAEQAGKAGYTPDQYQKMIEQNNTVTQAESDAIAKELGIPTVEGELFKKPSQSSQQIYEQAYASSGLADVKAKIQSIDDEIAKERALLTEAIGKIDENPFLTETSRVGRGKRILDQAEQRINNKLNQKKSYQDVYNQGISEVNNMVTRNQNDFNTDQTINTAKLNYLQKKAEQQATILKASKVSTATDLPTYMKSTAGQTSPKVIGTSETGYFTYDPTTKKFIQIAGTQKSTSTTSTKKTVSGTLTYTAQDQAEDSKALESSRGTDGYVDPTIYQNLYKAWIASGGVLKDFLTKYPPKNYVNPANTWLPTYLKPTATTTKKTTTTKATINDL